MWRLQATRVAYAGWREASPACAVRANWDTGGWPVSGSRTPPCTVRFEFPPISMRCSTRTCGIHVHRFPEYEKAGTATDAIELGDSGEKNGASCPATTAVRGQSSRMVPVRNLGPPRVT